MTTNGFGRSNVRARNVPPLGALDGTGAMTEQQQGIIITDQDPMAASDVEALASVFDTGGDGALSGDELNDSPLMVTNADGSTTAMTLAEFGITSINLTERAREYQLTQEADRSRLTENRECYRGDHYA